MIRSCKTRTRSILAASLVLCLTIAVHGQWNPANPVMSVEKQQDGVLLTMRSGLLKVQVCSDRIIRILYTPTSSFPNRPDYVIVKHSWPPMRWSMETIGDTVILATQSLRINVSRNDGLITFTDASGKKLFGDNSRTMTPFEVNGEKTWHAEMFSNLWGSSEAFYGLGGHQSGVWNYRGEAVDISQDNTNISIPFFLSSYGYGIFWNNTSRSRFNNRFLNALYLSSEVADVIDYYFIFGPSFDTVIGGYRALTGEVPMFGKWAYGFWQCKNRYASQDEVLEVARKYRNLHIPIDNIVQDWFWWYTMGEPVFDASRYPDPKGMVDELHKHNFHLMISFWPYFRPGTKTYEDMEKRGFFIDKTKVAGFHPEGQALYDAFNPDARKYYWNLIDTALFKIGADAWWLDTTEPETEGRETNILVTNKVAIGNGARYANLYPLMTTTGVYEGQRNATDQKRVFILSRSAFAGSQRTGTAVWSGDVNSDWVFFKKQIPSGLNYSVSGLPYWTTDIGGFLIGNPDDPAYRELFVRWFQFGAFNPIFRVHGTRTNNQNELWSYGLDAQKILINFTRLRYRLLPYIYSLAWMATNEAYTPMRALVMDFRTDDRSANIGDQFMFGPAYMVSPVIEPGASSRRVYLPSGKWYDFWIGRSLEGGRSFEAEAPIDRLPLFVRAGSIVPMGPEIEWSTEKPEDPIELRIYRGADGDFTMYEDEGDNYDYEKGVYATITFHWDERAQMLTIGDRKGKFPGMIESRSFQLVFVDEKHGFGPGTTGNVDQIVRYSGKRITISH
jgi:alpha-D-xyloside xylohydrolase